MPDDNDLTNHYLDLDWEPVPCPKCGKMNRYLVFGGENVLALFPNRCTYGHIDGFSAQFNLALKKEGRFFCQFCKEIIASNTADALAFLHSRGVRKEPEQK